MTSKTTIITIAIALSIVANTATARWLDEGRVAISQASPTKDYIGLVYQPDTDCKPVLTLITKTNLKDAPMNYYNADGENGFAYQIRIDTGPIYKFDVIQHGSSKGYSILRVWIADKPEIERQIATGNTLRVKFNYGISAFSLEGSAAAMAKARTACEALPSDANYFDET